MQIITIYQRGFNRGGNLNIRQLLNPIFFEHVRKHPDRKRQRTTRMRDKAIQAARELKRMEVPRLLIPPVELNRYDDEGESWREL